jgi:hypothetical protein
MIMKYSFYIILLQLFMGCKISAQVPNEQKNIIEDLTSLNYISIEVDNSMCRVSSDESNIIFIKGSKIVMRSVVIKYNNLKDTLITLNKKQEAFLLDFSRDVVNNKVNLTNDLIVAGDRVSIRLKVNKKLYNIDNRKGNYSFYDEMIKLK